jgi:molecular chaperone DnaJ
MTKKDLYEVLGVSRNANADEIKKAFRNKARHLHPDNMDSGDEAAFKELAAAYEVLSDQNKRDLYDRYGHDGLSGMGAGGFDGVDLGGFADLSEIFNQFFGGGMRSGGRRGGPERGSDLKLDLSLEFNDAVFGTKRTLTVKRLEQCTACSGSGAAEGSKPVTCVTCAGQGQVKQVTQTLLGHFTQVLTCPACQGEGHKIDKPCGSCKGKAQIRQAREFEVNIPAGIDSGTRLRVPGGGDYGRKGGGPGDLFVIIHVSDHPHFIREGTTIHLREKISYSLAALGGKLEVPTVDGERVLTIPPGTQTSTTLVMKGSGVPMLNNPTYRGDQLVHLVVETPTKLSSEEKHLLERLAQLRGENLSAGQETSFGKDKSNSGRASAFDKGSDAKSSGGESSEGKSNSTSADKANSDKSNAEKSTESFSNAKNTAGSQPFGSRKSSKGSKGKKARKESLIDKIADVFRTKDDD